MDTLLNPAARGPGLQRIRACLPELGRHGSKVAVFSALIGLVLWLARIDQRLDVQLVYSFATGLVSWLLIDLGRFWVDPDSPFGFPRGWRGASLVAGGIVGGFVIGTLVGDAYCGRSTWELFADKPRFFLYLFMLTLGIGSAISYYFYASGKTQYLHTALEASRRQASEAQLMLLQSQLEPHMLFNTLANLRALIGSDPERATAMLDRLNGFLRATLEASRESPTGHHTLHAEFERLRDYLELMGVRMGERLRFELHLPPKLAQHPVPPLLLQPLVENAIKHGLEPKLEGGMVRVSASAEAGMLTLAVEDTGLGLAHAPLQSNRAGFGLRQVRERLASAYGTTATMNLIALEHGGTLATVVFPSKNAD